VEALIDEVLAAHDQDRTSPCDCDLCCDASGIRWTINSGANMIESQLLDFDA
jgi:hypothetical protein